ncbi:hypothetical protein E1B28_005293 [Marasmius oreades]|uniref:Uncharacterized protein n=1 Tax=Marasmius oreades TaxID=181124 RepID=A0A9P7V0J6_9AGAR|nr:uncharacterized protein E1B28_005293 [Marasmius oreades]KAG7097985.1 hypothetical protein E1B28_005293 [Marasmius oreades]
MLWIDSQRGSLIRGMEGPECDTEDLRPVYVRTPSSSVELLQGDVYWRYLSQLPLDKEFDRMVLCALEEMSGHWESAANYKSEFSIVISASTLSTIAAGSVTWKVFGGCLSHGVVMPNGTQRFSLNGDSNNLWFGLETNSRKNDEAWLSQASSVFHQLGISLDQKADLYDYKSIFPDVQLFGNIDESDTFRKQRSGVPAIYIFLLCFDLSSSPLHYWSYDKTGKTCISDKTCQHLGLPNTNITQSVKISQQCCWSTETYKNIHKWQVDRGFDPTTAKFACYLGYPIFEALHPEPSQFEELDKENEGDSPPDPSSHSTEPIQGRARLNSIIIFFL